MKWEIKKVADGDYVAKKLVEDAEFPIGVVIFGPELAVKDEVLEELYRYIPNLVKIDNIGNNVNLIRKTISSMEPPCIVTIMNGDDSAVHEKRHGVVKTMRNVLGMKTIAGIYVRKTRRSDDIDLMMKSHDQMFKMIENPPTWTGCDFYITVS